MLQQLSVKGFSRPKTAHKPKMWVLLIHDWQFQIKNHGKMCMKAQNKYWLYFLCLSNQPSLLQFDKIISTQGPLTNVLQSFQLHISLEWSSLISMELWWDQSSCLWSRASDVNIFLGLSLAFHWKLVHDQTGLWHFPSPLMCGLMLLMCWMKPLILEQCGLVKVSAMY